MGVLGGEREETDHPPRQSYLCGSCVEWYMERAEGAAEDRERRLFFYAQRLAEGTVRWVLGGTGGS